MAPAPPPITTRTAIILLVLYGLSYFLPFYASSSTRPSATLHRDAPSVIGARVRRVVVSCCVCSAMTFAMLVRAADATPQEALHVLGYFPAGLAESTRALVLTMMLFMGPLFGHLVADGGWRAWARLEPPRELLHDWTKWRNIVVGPLTEEILFRSASMPLLMAAHVSARRIVFFGPLVFGLAHVHHFYDFRVGHPHDPVLHLLLRSLFQFAFTTVFGGYATFVYLRSGSVLAPFLVHAFCNAMSLPQVWGRVRPASADEDERGRPQQRLAVPVEDPGQVPGRGRRGSRAAREPSILWTVAYYTLLVSGAILFYRNLWTLTESQNALLPQRAFASR